ncbi:hypothetical protein CYY_001271 [Polysphondylium violaceum]|uniref:B box-type domain-containing protein n=1 Tax=Polysphondylium violaceum TaxID=133409 RepID=A0A8J4Q2A3_9MYCE|nr:hypothetical protein CYY_001271 [Polysphondylium violaceum]
MQQRDVSKLRCEEHYKLVRVYCCSCDAYFCRICDTIRHRTSDDAMHIRVPVNKEILEEDHIIGDDEDDLFPVTTNHHHHHLSNKEKEEDDQIKFNLNNDNSKLDKVEKSDKVDKVDSSKNNSNSSNNNNNNNKNKNNISSSSSVASSAEDVEDRATNEIIFKNTYEKFQSNSCALEEGEEDDSPCYEQEKEASHIVQGLVEGVIFLGTGIATGITGVVAEPVQGVKEEGAKGFFKGLAKGVSGVALNPMKGASGFLTKTAEGLRNTPNTIFTKKEDLVEPVKEKEAAHLLEGLYQGTISLSKGILDGVTGVVLEPIKGVRDEGGAKGFFKGVGKGLMGVVVKPISGVTDFIAKPLEGIANTPQTIIQAIDSKQQQHQQSPTQNKQQDQDDSLPPLL